MQTTRIRVGLSCGLALALLPCACARREPGMAQLKAGIRQLRKAIALESMPPGHAQQNDLSKAAALLEQACAKRPASPSAHLNLGLVYWKQGRLDEAVASLGQASLLAYEDPRPFEFLAAIYAKREDWDAARAALDAANQRLSYAPRILTAMAVTEYRSGRTALAESFLAQALDQCPEHAPALYNMAVLQRDLHRDQEKARAYFTQYLAALQQQGRSAPPSPLDRAALQDRRRVAEAFLLDEEQEEQAEHRTAPPPAMKPGSRDEAMQLSGRGLQAYNAGDADQAIRLYVKALELDPRLASASYNLGLAHRTRSDTAAARAAFLRTIEIDTEFVRAYYMLGLILREQKQDAQAIAYLDQVLEKDAHFARAHFVLALIYRDRGQTTLARNHLEHFIRLAPDDPYAARARELLGE